ncbi:MAG: nitroreductase family protein [Lachnospiraceae bacterium]|nr:nitroreductase family protein [Lachnospiraceae bacterium]
MQNIYHRTSVRKYTEDRVERSKIMQILRAAMAAPSAGNQQPWEFYVTRDPEKRQALADSSPYSKPAGRCDVCILVCKKADALKHPGMSDQDLGACCENILLEAEHLGLGTVWLGTKPEQSRMDACARIFSCAPEHEPYALICVGYSADPREATAAKRYEESRVHWV